MLKLGSAYEVVRPDVHPRDEVGLVHVLTVEEFVEVHHRVLCHISLALSIVIVS